jgi:hypothetical protein
MITDREQIHNLAKLTGCQIVKNVCGNPMFTMTTYELQQYTEMVVRKCTNIVLHYTDVDEGVSVAKKHFGVEK